MDNRFAPNLALPKTPRTPKKAIEDPEMITASAPATSNRSQTPTLRYLSGPKADYMYPCTPTEAQSAFARCRGVARHWLSSTPLFSGVLRRLIKNAENTQIEMQTCTPSTRKPAHTICSAPYPK